MAKIRHFAGGAAASILIFVGVGANSATPEIQVGAAAKVVNSVYGTPESTHQARWWRPGLDVFHNETVVTAELSASRVVFKDNSLLSIGPTSWVKLDTFVYDPNPGAASVSISFVKGVFRFVSGGTARENYKMEIPAAFIGVRGTAFTVAILPDGRELISVESGTVYVTCRRGVTVVLNAGQMTVINSPTGSPNPAQLATPIPAVAQMDAILQ